VHGQSDLVRLLYDPVSYYRPWRCAVAGLSAAQRSGLNVQIIRQHHLPGYDTPTASQRWLVDRLVNAWHVLPSVAFLMACAKLRSAVVSDRGYLAQPPVAHAFMRLGFSEHASHVVSAVDTSSLLGWGGQYLQALGPRLPSWLGARLALPFAGLNPVVAGVTRPQFEPDLTCFWSALTYANDPQLCSRLRD
jgi:type III secretion system OrgA/MxiK family protein